METKTMRIRELYEDQEARDVLYTFGTPDKEATLGRLGELFKLNMAPLTSEVMVTLLDVLSDSSVTQKSYRQFFHSLKHRKELVLIRMTAEYVDMYRDFANPRPWSGLAKVRLMNAFGHECICRTIFTLAQLHELATDPAMQTVIKELMDELRDMEALTPDVYSHYLEGCRHYMLTHVFRSDEDILGDYKDGGYTGVLARTDRA